MKKIHIRILAAAMGAMLALAGCTEPAEQNGQESQEKQETGTAPSLSHMTVLEKGAEEEGKTETEESTTPEGPISLIRETGSTEIAGEGESIPSDVAIQGDEQAAMAFLAHTMKERFMSVAQEKAQEEEYGDFAEFFRACAVEAELSYTDYKSIEEILQHCAPIERPVMPGDILAWGDDPQNMDMGLYIGDEMVITVINGKLTTEDVNNLSLPYLNLLCLDEWRDDVPATGIERPDGCGVTIDMENVTEELYNAINGDFQGLAETVSHCLDEVGMTSRPITVYIDSYEATLWPELCQIIVTSPFPEPFVITYTYETKQFRAL